MCINLKNDIPVCQRARRLSCSEKLQTVCNAPKNLRALAVETEKKRDRFEQTTRTLERKISMLSTKDQLIKKDVLVPDGSDKNQDSKINVFLLNLPDVEESLSVPSFLYVSDSPLVSMKKEKRNTYRCGQRTVRLAGCGIQEIQSFSREQRSLRAQAQLSETKTETDGH
ncbi:hypothetical protein TNCV_2772641 [Trichonephila clavipes]|nr:hypothetical protein TNCV_2772641 [Trichonephila clavipes]